jgi:hypothetical protein
MMPLHQICIPEVGLTSAGSSSSTILIDDLHSRMVSSQFSASDVHAASRVNITSFLYRSILEGTDEREGVLECATQTEAVRVGVTPYDLHVKRAAPSDSLA